MAKGRFIPKNPQKYMGNPSQIFFRSSWELTVMKFFDNSNSVLRYASEEVAIPYVSPKDGRVHRYFPDFICQMMNASQQVEKWIIEVKPLKETKIEFAKTVYDKMALAVNEAKWAAAEKFAQLNGMKFIVITEIDIFKMSPPKPKKQSNKPKIIKPKKAIKAKK